MAKKGIFIGATGQNVGKTTLCLGLMSGLMKKHQKVSFLKPVGQRHVLSPLGGPVDKDVVLFKDHFSLSTDYALMSPVIFPSGFTRDYLDGLYDPEGLKKKILQSYKKLASENDFTLVEGTGHIGVGSIANLNNAQVAKFLGLDVILITEGGIGKAFDHLALNRQLLSAYRVKIKGVILNRVLEEKKEMIESYMTKALKKWDIPLIGSIPFCEFLSNPSFKDLEDLFKTTLFSGHQHHFRHFEKIRFIAMNTSALKEEIQKRHLVITPASREDVVLLMLKMQKKLKSKGEDLEGGLILTGEVPPTLSLLKKLEKEDLPSFYTPLSNFEVMKKITSFTAKILNEDAPKVLKAIELVEHNINFELI